MAAFGCGLIGFGPVGVLFFLVVARDPLQVILFTIRSVPIPHPFLKLFPIKCAYLLFVSTTFIFPFSAFFWLAGLLAASVIWYAVVPLREQLAFGIVFACLLQEVMRFLFYLIIK